MYPGTVQQIGFVLGIVAVVVVLFAGTPFASAQVTNRIVARSGDTAPGTFERFVTFANPVISATGDVAFQANTSGEVSDVVPHGIWTLSQSALRPLAIAGRVAPDARGARFHTTGWPIALADNGQSLFYGSLVHEGSVTADNDYGIWEGTPENVTLIARRSDPAPGLPDGVNYSLVFANPHSSGLMGFSASLMGAGVDATNNSAVWSGPIGPMSAQQLIARAGDLAPGLSPDARFRSLGTPWINANGQVALLATAGTSDPTAAQIPGIWAGPPDRLSLVASAQTTAPGTTNRRFSFFSDPRINNTGIVAFMGNLESESDEQRLSDVGIWAGPINSNVIQPIALEGQQAPGFASGVVFRGSAPGDEVTYDAFGNPVLSGKGNIAFAATVFGAGMDFDHNDGVWISDAVSTSGAPRLTLVAREGDQPPGTPTGTRFAGVFTGDDLIPAFERPMVNSKGQVAFEASTTGPLGTFGRGLWGTDSSGDLQLIAHTGDDFAVAPGDVRKVSLLKLNAGGSSEGGYLSAFNDDGQLAFAVSFTDGSEAIVIATVVPEPSTFILSIVAVALMSVLVRAAQRDS